LHIELLRALLPQLFDHGNVLPERNHITLATPEEIAAAVRRLSPTIGGERPVLPPPPARE
jgi:hypothetical protein